MRPETQRAKANKKARALYQKRQAAGICVKCSSLRGEGGDKSRCESCRQIYAVTHLERKATGRCPYCSQEWDGDTYACETCKQARKLRASGIKPDTMRMAG